MNKGKRKGRSWYAPRPSFYAPLLTEYVVGVVQRAATVGIVVAAVGVGDVTAPLPRPVPLPCPGTGGSSARAALAAMTSIITAANSTASLLLNTSSVLLP